MTQKFVGLDIGTAVVKAVMVRQGLRGRDLLAVESEPIAGDGDVALTAAIQALWGRMDAADAQVFCALSGDMVSLHEVDVPKSASKKAREVLAFELDDRLPYDVEDAVFDFVELGQSHEVVHYLVAAARVERLERVLDALAACGIDPAVVTVAPWCYAETLREAVADRAPVMLVDVGSRRTHLVVVGDARWTGRTVLRGTRDIVRKLAEASGLPEDEVVSRWQAVGMSGKAGEVAAAGLAALEREIRATLAAHQAGGGQAVRGVLLCGGGARIPGLDAAWSEKFGVPVTPCSAAGVPGESRIGDDTVLAYCLALTAVVPPDRRMNLRTGPLMYKGDEETARQKRWGLVGMVLAVAAAWMFWMLAHHWSVSQQYDQARQALEKETKRVLGKPTVSRALIERTMGTPDKKASPVPRRDAYDIVVELSRRIPDSVVHDVEELRIKPGSVVLRGLVDSELGPGVTGEEADLSPTDLIKSRLARFDECFVDFRIPKVRTVGNRQQYTMEIETTCP